MFHFRKFFVLNSLNKERRAALYLHQLQKDICLGLAIALVSGKLGAKGAMLGISHTESPTLINLSILFI